MLPAEARAILVWHQGALGDVLVALPALTALARHYPQARFTLVGGRDQLSLLAATLPVAAVWSGHQALWLELYQNGGLSPTLTTRLAPFDLAVVFTPRSDPAFLARLAQAGVGRVVWLPSFPPPGSRQSCRGLQAAALAALGLPGPLPPGRLIIPGEAHEAVRRERAAAGCQDALAVALAPGSGHPRKNWPLENYLQLAARLTERWQAHIWWLLGPAEAALAPHLAAGGPGQPRHSCLTGLPLVQVAAWLADMDLYVGNDSGITHLAAAVAGPKVAAIFGPSDPLVWAPAEAAVLTAAAPCAPCSEGRTIACAEPRCLTELPVAAVLAGIQGLGLRAAAPEDAPGG
jgi:ADP-heptose:LPS heptosyltransferase